MSIIPRTVPRSWRALRSRLIIIAVTLAATAAVAWIQQRGWIALPATPSAAPHDARESSQESLHVERVIDGDTVVLADGRTVRYIGIDAPETGSMPGRPHGCWADEATALNRTLVAGKDIRMERDRSETDRYGRLLRYVWVGDTLVNEVLVAQGAAVAKDYKPDTAYSATLHAAQARAQADQAGMWGGCK